MKLMDLVQGTGRPIAYYPAIAPVLGGIKESVLFCQLLYWSDKGRDPDGWIYKTADELKAETHLSYSEQRRVRTRLKKMGVLEESHRRLEHRIYFRVNTEVFRAIWDKHLEAQKQARATSYSPNNS